jgi:hypothetical protein
MQILRLKACLRLRSHPLRLSHKLARPLAQEAQWLLQVRFERQFSEGQALLDDAMYEMIKSVYMSLNTKFAS